MEYLPDLSDETAEKYQEYVNMFKANPFAEETSAKGVRVMEHNLQGTTENMALPS